MSNKDEEEELGRGQTILGLVGLLKTSDFISTYSSSTSEILNSGKSPL